MAGEQRGDGVEVVGGAGQAVDQDDGRAGPWMFEAADTQLADLHEGARGPRLGGEPAVGPVERDHGEEEHAEHGAQQSAGSNESEHGRQPTQAFGNAN